MAADAGAIHQKDAGSVVSAQRDLNRQQQDAAPSCSTR
jgi:hypothetical protein